MASLRGGAGVGLLIGFRFGFRHAIPPFRFGFAILVIVGFVCVLLSMTFRFAALGNGGLHNLVVQAVRFVDEPLGGEDFGFDPRPQQ